METKKEITRLEAQAKLIQSRVKSLQELLRENVNSEAIPKATQRTRKPPENLELESENIASA